MHVRVKWTTPWPTSSGSSNGVSRPLSAPLLLLSADMAPLGREMRTTCSGVPTAGAGSVEEAAGLPFPVVAVAVVAVPSDGSMACTQLVSPDCTRYARTSVNSAVDSSSSAVLSVMRRSISSERFRLWLVSCPTWTQHAPTVAERATGFHTGTGPTGYKSHSDTACFDARSSRCCSTSKGGEGGNTRSCKRDALRYLGLPLCICSGELGDLALCRLQAMRQVFDGVLSDRQLATYVLQLGGQQLRLGRVIGK